MDEKLKNLKEYLENDDNVIFAVLFGSAAIKCCKKNSKLEPKDLDIGIYFKNPPKGLEVLNYINILSNIVKKDVDLVILNNASAFLRHQIMKNKLVLVIKDRKFYIKFREKTIEDYQEYKYLSGIGTI